MLGHVGITVGLAWAAGRASIKITGNDVNINYGLVALGSILPDIIDKPLGHVILKESLNNGRILGHTLLFVSLLFLFAMLTRHRGRGGSLSVFFGSAAHLALDKMWERPATLFWPLYGWGFPYGSGDFWLRLIQNMHKPENYIPEILGAAILVLFLIERRRKHGAGLKYRNWESGIGNWGNINHKDI